MGGKNELKFKIAALAVLLVFFLPSVAEAETKIFNVEPNYDYYSRNQIEAVLHRTTNKMSFYIEKGWWDGLKEEKKSEIGEGLYKLSAEFEYRIYPEMTSVFGPEPDHPIDDSGRLTILFHRMVSGAGGYVNSGDQYSRYQYSRSNERNMAYINTAFLDSPMLSGFLAHEFMHLITFNAKEKKHNVREEVWLNEARAEYMPTFFGYNGEGESNLLRRKENFIKTPDNPLTEWLNRSADYGAINMFTQYLVDHYGVEILIDSLQSDKIGIESINLALKKNGYQEDFDQIFTDWTIAVLVNDCSLGEKYCYLNEDLKDLRIAPQTSYLPRGHGSSFSIKQGIKNWSGNWYRVVGGSGDLVVEFKAEEEANFQIPYFLCDIDDSCQVGFIQLNREGRGSVRVDNFGKEYKSLTIIPSVRNKTAGFNGEEKSVYFSWSAVAIPVREIEESTQRLLDRIEELKREIARLQNLLAARRGTLACAISSNLSFGSRGDEVECLQQFLKAENVYPEGLITGNFLTLTRQAVIRFQEKYAEDILYPLSLARGTGYVGPMTRSKISEIQRLR